LPEDRLQWALAPWRTLELIAPGFFAGRPGATFAPVFYQLGGPTQYGIPFLPSVFVGAVPIALAVTGARVSRCTTVITGAALVFLWIALGMNLGAEQLLRNIPLWGAFRYSEKLVGPFTLCVAVLAAFGADRVAALPLRSAVGTAIVAALIAVLAAILAYWPGAEQLFRGTGANDAAGLAREQLAIGFAHAATGLALLAAALAASLRPSVQRQFQVIAVILVLIQSIAASQYSLHIAARGVREKLPLQGIEKPDTFVRIGVPASSIPNLGPLGPDEFERLSAIESRMGMTSYNIPSRIDQVMPYTGLMPRRFINVYTALSHAFGPQALWVALRRFTLTNVVLGPVADPQSMAVSRAAVEGGQLVHQDITRGIAVWRVPHRSWAFFAEAVVSASSETEAYQQLVEVLASGGSEVVLEGTPPVQLTPGRVVSVTRATDWLKIEAESDGEGLLVVNDSFWPGWKATIDGRPVPILPADGFVRAIMWPAGSHALKMWYDPIEVKLGLYISAVGTSILFALMVVDIRRHKIRETG
jgi:hypothetical protein